MAEPFYERADGPVHDAFGLTYASYFVVPRSILQSMPTDWQQRFVDLMNELHECIPYEEIAPDYQIVCKGEKGRFVKDSYREYRRAPDYLLALRPPSSASSGVVRE